MSRPSGPATRYRGMNQEVARYMRDMYFSRRATQVQLARWLRVSQSTVSKVISGETWK